MAFSFNEPRGKFNLTWKGFTLDNWADPFKYPQLTDALETSLRAAAVSTACAVVLGTLVAVALVRHRFRGSGATDTFLVLPMTAPEVVMGASLLTLFIDLGWNRGFLTIVVAHRLRGQLRRLTVKARLRGFDWTLEDAAMDLGATPTRVFLRVTLPLILPGIVAAAMLSFALSLDDFIITYFNSGSTVTTRCTSTPPPRPACPRRSTCWRRRSCSSASCCWAPPRCGSGDAGHLTDDPNASP